MEKFKIFIIGLLLIIIVLLVLNYFELAESNNLQNKIVERLYNDN